MSHNAHKNVRLVTIGLLSTGIMASMAIPASATAPASAFTAGSQDKCVVTPARWNTITTAAQTHVEQRWLRNLLGQDKVEYDETKFQYTIAGNDEVAHEQWKYYNFVPGLEKIAHNEFQYSRTNPGEKELYHKEYQYTRENPGQAKVAHDERQFARTNPGQAEQSHMVYKYAKTTSNSHKEYQLKKTVKVYTVEHKKVQIPSKGPDRDRALSWLSQIGATDLGGNWWQLPDSVVAAAGVNPHNVAQSGSVNLSSYGGPRVTVSYQITGIETYDQPPAGSFVDIGNQTVYYTGGSSFSLKQSDAVWTRETPAGWNVFNTKTVQDPDTTEYYNGGNWTTDVNPAGWTKIAEDKIVTQEYKAPFTEFRAADGSATPDVNNAGWFKELTFDGWTQYGDPKEVVTQQYIAPFPEYLAQDGSATTDVNNAGWFEETSVEGWGRYGAPKRVVDREAIDPFTEYLAQDGSATTDVNNAGWFEENPGGDWEHFGDSKEVVTQYPTEDQTFFLKVDDQGNLVSTTNGEEATWFTSDEGIDQQTWTEFGRIKVVTQEETPDTVVYLTMDESGNLGYTQNLDEATWLPVGFAGQPIISDPGSIWEEMIGEQGNPLIDPTTDLSLWRQVTNPDGTPLVQTVVLQEEIPPSTVYYVPGGGQPTSMLGDSNWTTDSPEDWIFVDKREVTDKAASTTKTLVSAESVTCTVVSTNSGGPSKLAETGSNPANLAGLGGLAVLAGGLMAGAHALNRRRNGGQAADNTQTLNV